MGDAVPVVAYGVAAEAGSGRDARSAGDSNQTLPIPSYVHGISIDFYGYVWGVTLFEPYAYSQANDGGKRAMRDSRRDLNDNRADGGLWGDRGQDADVWKVHYS